MKIVGKVTEEEKLIIKKINNHRIALEELLLVLTSDDELYNKAKNDLESTMIQYQEWWNQHYIKYSWEKGISDWKILFDTNEIIIEED